MQMIQSRTHNVAALVVNLPICVYTILEQDIHMDISLHIKMDRISASI